MGRRVARSDWVVESLMRDLCKQRKRSRGIPPRDCNPPEMHPTQWAVIARRKGRKASNIEAKGI